MVGKINLKMCYDADASMILKVSLMEKFGAIKEYWTPRIAAELNGQYLKLVKVKGEFLWHKHDNEDELFLVVKGKLEIHLRDQVVTLNDNDFLVVPKDVEHKPVAAKEVLVILLEPKSTVNTGDKVDERTIKENSWI